MSNLDVLRAMMAAGPEATEQHDTKQLTAKTAASAGGEPIGWEDSVSIDGGSTSATSAATRDRDELMDMCAEVNILDLAREDTGEIGRQSGNCVSFHTCPVCGRHDCFRAYPETNSWACFSASNPNADPSKDASGGNVLDYLEQARHMQKTEAVKWLRDRTGRPFQPARQADRADGRASATANDGLTLPPWDAIRAANPPKKSPQLIHGVLRRGHVGLLAATAKAGKSWSGIELCTAIATGGYWMGFKCERGRCLFIDPEIDPLTLHNRFHDVCEALGIDPTEIDRAVKKWSLRGVPNASMENIIHDIGVRARETDASFDLVFIDSCSCLIEGDENSATDIRAFFNKVHEVAKLTGGAVMVTHHFGKGNAGDREASDRARGSSVWRDAPDEPLALTEVFPKEGEPSDYLPDGARAFVLEDLGSREFKPLSPHPVIFDFPRHYTDTERITADWRPRTSAGWARGGQQTAKLKKAEAGADRARLEADILAWFYAEGIGTEGRGITECANHFGVTPGRIQAAVEESDHLEIYKPSKNRKRVVPLHIPQCAGGEGEECAPNDPLPLDTGDRDGKSG